MGVTEDSNSGAQFIPATNVDNHDFSKETKEINESSSSNSTSLTLPAHEGVDNSNAEHGTDALQQRGAQENDAIEYPGGLRLFLLAFVTPSIMEPLPSMRRLIEPLIGSRSASPSFSLRWTVQLSRLPFPSLRINFIVSMMSAGMVVVCGWSGADAVFESYR